MYEFTTLYEYKLAIGIDLRMYATLSYLIYKKASGVCYSPVFSGTARRICERFAASDTKLMGTGNVGVPETVVPGTVPVPGTKMGMEF